MSPVVVVAVVFMVPVTFVVSPTLAGSGHSEGGSSTHLRTAAFATLRGSTHTFRRPRTSSHRPRHSQDQA